MDSKSCVKTYNKPGKYPPSTFHTPPLFPPIHSVLGGFVFHFLPFTLPLTFPPFILF